VCGALQVCQMDWNLTASTLATSTDDRHVALWCAPCACFVRETRWGQMARYRGTHTRRKTVRGTTGAFRRVGHAVCRLMVFGFCRSRNLGTGEWQMQATVVGQ
jgi:hypothetical protein